MSSFEYLREFVNERLTAAAEEIFGVFHQTIVQYEEELERQRRLLDVVWNPEIKLHRIELPQQYLFKEEAEDLTDQQLCIQRSPEPPQIKEEQEEVCTSQEGEQLVLKQETDAFMLTPTHEESEDQTLNFHPEDTEECANKPVLSRDQTEDKQEDPELTTDAVLTPQERHPESKSYNDNVQPTTSKTDSTKNLFQCETCGKAFKFKYRLQRHLIIHTETIPSSLKTLKCDTCGKVFMFQSDLDMHKRIHSGEKPYLCTICGTGFSQKSSLNIHVRIHTGEKPYLCNACGKRFSQVTALHTHNRIHTGEKPYTCKTCGKAFRLRGDLTVHMRIHTGEKPYTCITCGRSFRLSGTLTHHMRRAHNG